jgi:hypothetical protein
VCPLGRNRSFNKTLGVAATGWQPRRSHDE